MQNPPRFIPDWPFPPYIFTPGINAHPEKEGGYMHGKKLISEPIDPLHPLQNQYFAYALDLFNYHYYWESHVYFEVLWNLHGRQGPIADFLKGMIKLGAAGVKFNLGQDEAANGHILRAQELLQEISLQQGDQILCFSINEILNDLKSDFSEIVILQKS